MRPFQASVRASEKIREYIRAFLYGALKPLTKRPKEQEEMGVKCLMRYAITSGRVVEKRDVLMEINLDPTKKRTRGRRRAKSAEKQIERNGNETVLRLARILNSNFKGGDLFLTLKYDNGRLPDTLEEAKRLARNFMNRIARAYQKTTGEKLRWVLVTADRSAKTGEPVRLHHHIVMDAVDWELISKHWPADQFSYRRLDGSGDYIGVARYMVRNAGYVRGRRTWSSSQGLEKPVFSEPVPVKKAGSYRVPKEAKGIYREVKEDSESGFYAAYIRYVMPKETRTDDPQHNAERYGRETGKIRNTEARG